MEYARKNSFSHNYGNTDCCKKPLPPACNQGASTVGGSGSIQDVLVAFGGIYADAFGSLDIFGIEYHLNRQNPLIMRWESLTDPNHGHAMVICGISWNDIDIMDPDNGYLETVSYNTLLNNGTFFWDKTLAHKYPSHCCNGKLDADKGEKGIDCGGPCAQCYTPPPPLPGCDNCIKDQGETEIDCGGPKCPPCEDVPIVRVITNTNQLRTETMAFEKITASGTTTVAAGKNVSFITEEDGLIVLLPGFKAEQGSKFSTQRKDLSGYSRICGYLCLGIQKFPPVIYRDLNEQLYIDNLLHAKKIKYDIYDIVNGEYMRLIYSNIINVAHNGRLYLWDGKTNAINTSGAVTYHIYYNVDYCNGNNHSNSDMFVVANKWKGKSPNKDPDDPENPETHLSPPPNNITLQDEIPAPNFSIIPNPNPGTFQIETNFSLSDIANFKITNSLGAPVYETQNLFSNTIQLPTSTSGLHFVVAVLKDGTVLTQKMMLQR